MKIEELVLNFNDIISNKIFQHYKQVYGLKYENCFVKNIVDLREDVTTKNIKLINFSFKPDINKKNILELENNNISSFINIFYKNTKQFTLHFLKLDIKFYQSVKLKIKTFEIRLNDREYKLGDYLLLSEYDSTNKRYIGNFMIRKINYILKEVQGLNKDYVILGIEESE